MFKISINNPEALLVFDEVAKRIPTSAEKVLDLIASAAQQKMGMEAPKGITGQLSNNIEVGRSENRRVIEPVAKNPSGGKYALPIETGWGPSFPNIRNIGLYYGADPRLAYAIALGISKKKHAPDNFVERTADYLIGILPRLAKEFADNIVIGVRAMSRGL